MFIDIAGIFDTRKRQKHPKIVGIVSICSHEEARRYNDVTCGKENKVYLVVRSSFDSFRQDTPQLSVRTIQTPQDLLLLHRIAANLGTLELRLSYIESPMLGPDSEIANGEWEILRMKLSLMTSVKKWPELFTITSDLLRRARTKDQTGQLSEDRFSDWVVWDTFLLSASSLQLQGSSLYAE